METTQDPGRPSASDVAPRARLVVEEYVPEPRAAGAPGRERPRSAGLQVPLAATRFLAGGSVVLLHACLGAWLLLAPHRAQRLHPPAEPLVLLDPIAAPARLDRAIELPAPDMTTISLPPLPVPRLAPMDGGTEVALVISPATDILIRDADMRAVAAIVQGCRIDTAAAQGSAERSAEVTLLVRVEGNGLVSDAKVEISSGTQRIDMAVQRCLSANRVLPAHRTNGVPVASWQRVHWFAARGRRPTGDS